jgi:hypothetical protein
MDLVAGEGATQMRNDPGRHTQPAAVEEVGQAVELAGVEAGVGQDDLKGADGGRVPRLRRPDIASNAVQE